MARLEQMTALEIEAIFPDEASCRAYLARRRWPDQVCCPRCGNAKVYALRSPTTWQCHACNPKGYQFSVLVGTVFEKTKIPLRKWFRAIHLILSKSNVTIVEVQRYIGLGSNRSAWLLCRRIRSALQDDGFRTLVGIGDVTETGQTYRSQRSPDVVHVD